MISLFEVFLLIVTAILALFLFARTKFNYWSSRGVVHLKWKFPVGELSTLGTENSLPLIIKQIYEKFKKLKSIPFGGVYFLINPVVIVMDLDLVKNILVKDFENFQNRGLYVNERDDPLSAHLFALEKIQWKQLRTKLTPTFTSAKMKTMFPIMVNIGENLQKVIEEIAKKNNEIELKDILGHYTTDVIGSCAFGIECNSLNDPKVNFYLMAQKFFQLSNFDAFKQFFVVIFPSFSRFLHIKLIPSDVSNFFMKIVKDTIAFREQNDLKRNDFMDMLIQLKNKGRLDDDPTKNVGQLTVNEIAAQAFIFFIAGYETSSTTLVYCFYEMALNLDIQEKARQHINDILSQNGGTLTYEAVMGMTYLDQIINETLRKYPPISNTPRSATNDYQVPGTKFIIEKNIMVLIPIYGIHHDPDIYPNPEIFDPNRFNKEEILKRHTYSFLPFGDGPRNCIGIRFAMLEIKISLIALLSKFIISPTSKTPIPIVFSKKCLIHRPERGIHLNFEPIMP